MIRGRKVATVATFELLAAVKRPGYLIATFGMPLFMALYAGVVAIPAYYAEQKDREPALYGVVDHAGVLRLQQEAPAGAAHDIPEELRQALEAAGRGGALHAALAQNQFVFSPMAAESEAMAALAARRIRGFFVVPGDYLADGHLDSYTPDSVTLSGSDARRAFGELLRERLVAARVDGAAASRILRPIAGTAEFAVTRLGEVRDGGAAASAVRLVVPLLFMFLFLLSILMTSGYLLQGTATEKENKVVEVLLASANPDEILTGKLLGLGAAGLLQISVWVMMVLATGVGVVPLLLAARVEVPWTAIALAVPFFVVAFLFFGGLMLGTGSLGSNMREAQQLAMVWSLTAALPLMLMAVLLREPNGVVARVLTWIPFTSGPIVVLRASADAASLPWWEAAGALLVLMLSTWIALRVGARLFRVGLLSAGARPSLREILRQARLAG